MAFVDCHPGRDIAAIQARPRLAWLLFLSPPASLPLFVPLHEVTTNFPQL